MAGSKEGSRKAVAKILARDPDFFKKIGQRGGMAGKGEGYEGGFAHPNADPRAAGIKGGRISRRKKTNKEKV